MLKNPSQRAKTLNKKKVVHILSGSIAAYKAPEISERLRQSGLDVTCVLTAAAKKFVTVDTLRALSGNSVYDDMWSISSPHDVLHTALADSADLILVAPASADFLARASIGMANDLAACILLASQAPVWWVPAMNDNMYKSPLTQANIEKLKKIGHHFINPIEGNLACGRTAIGHIADTETVVKSVTQALAVGK
ncbi:MAG TPA: flavoprotein [Candidatus Omnitrophota bacterium]|nr:flavoprotein [Candidatus Omnitrophota bacterium]